MYKPTSESISEAESRPLEFNPNERATYIRKMLHDITLWIEQGLTHEDVREKASDFIESYPELFKKIINGQDLTPVQNMLEMLDKMGEGRLSQHQASVIVGKKLVDRYVTPQLKGV